jgi:hypothetical protein
MSHEALDITVVGHGAATYPPEQCTLSLTVRTDGRTAESASEPAQQLVRELTRLVEPLSYGGRPVNDGMVKRWHAPSCVPPLPVAGMVIDASGR